MLQAMNTGHEGSLSTLHANTPRDALSRIETMVLMAGYDLPVKAIRQQVASALDMVVHLERLAGRLASCHGGHRGAGHGVRRDHAAGSVHVQDRLVLARRHGRRRRFAPRAYAPVLRTSSSIGASTFRQPLPRGRGDHTRVEDRAKPAMKRLLVPIVVVAAILAGSASAAGRRRRSWSRRRIPAHSRIARTSSRCRAEKLGDQGRQGQGERRARQRSHRSSRRATSRARRRRSS